MRSGLAPPRGGSGPFLSGHISNGCRAARARPADGWTGRRPRAAWQTALGSEGLFPLWNDQPGRPWASGLGPAVWVHATAALPWVILIVGTGLTMVEGELEEDALLVASPWRVLWRVTLPRCRASV